MNESGRVKTALVTGGATRVGAAIAHELLQAGYDVLVHYFGNEDGAKKVVQTGALLNRRVEICRADLADRQHINPLVESTLRFADSGLDLLVHNAANFERVEPRDLDAGAWDRAMALNTTAPYLLTLQLSEALKNARGSVVAIGCISAHKPWKNYLPYSVSKAALVHLIKGFAISLAPEVRCNAIAPGTVMAPESYTQEQLDKLAQSAPLQRLGSANDIAKAVLFFAQNAFVTGQVLNVDGGRSLV